MVGVVMPLKDRIRELRIAAGLTQQDLAVKAGLTTGAVAQLEAGKIKDPRMSTLKALAKALGTTVDALIADDDAPADQGGAESPEPPAGGRKGKRKGGKG